MDNYFKIQSNHKEPCPPSREWVAQESGNLFCPKCNCLLRENVKKTFDAVLGFNPPPGHRIMGSLSWVGVCIYHIEFVLQMKKELNECGFVIGKCFNSEGDLIPEYVTCYNQLYTIQRGGYNTPYRICDFCGTISQKQWWHGRQYLTAKSVKENKIVQNAIGYLYLEEKIYKEIDISFWDDAEFEKIVILEEPEDGQVFML